MYKANSNIKAVVHVHSAGVLGLSLLPENKIQPIFDNIKHLTGKIGFCDYHQSGSIELADNLANKAKNLYSAVIMKRHGLVIFSESLEEAITKIQIVEDISIYILLSIKSKKIPKINIPDFILNFQPHQTNKNKIKKEINQFINRLINSKIASPLYCIFVIRFKIRFRLVFVSGNKIFTRIYLDDSINSDIINERQLTHFFNHNPHINIVGFFFPIHVMSLIQIVPDFPSNLTAESNLILKSIQTCNLHSINNLFSEAFQKWTTETNALVFPNTGFFTAAQNYFQVFDRIEVAENLAKSLHLIIHSNENVQLPD